VLAKDCAGGKTPKFAVTMKALGHGQQNEAQQDKKVRVISRDEVIECQPEQQGHQQQHKKIQCTLNGQPIKPHQHQQSVEYNNDDQSSVTINVPGVQVRFNGKKAWIKLSKLYKNKQCGLCGHYDEDSDNDLRMGDTNEPTSDLEKFHRSFSIPDSQECTTEQQDSFYSSQKQKGAFRRVPQSNSEQREDEDETDDSWWGTSAKKTRAPQETGCKYACAKLPPFLQPACNKGCEAVADLCRNKCDSTFPPGAKRTACEMACGLAAKMPPQKLTMVVESRAEICFSQSPITRCPDGTTPVEQDENGNDYSSSEEQQRPQQGGEIKRVPFVCYDRSSSEARRALQQVRQSGVANLGAQEPAFTQEVRVPEMCLIN
jgi:hypothetical protein